MAPLVTAIGSLFVPAGATAAATTAAGTTAITTAAAAVGTHAAAGGFKKAKGISIPKVAPIAAPSPTISEAWKQAEQKKIDKFRARRQTILTGGLGSLGELWTRKKTLLGD